MKESKIRLSDKLLFVIKDNDSGLNNIYMGKGMANLICRLPQRFDQAKVSINFEDAKSANTLYEQLIINRPRFVFNYLHVSYFEYKNFSHLGKEMLFMKTIKLSIACFSTSEDSKE